jgi:hypothetical protein
MVPTPSSHALSLKLLLRELRGLVLAALVIALPLVVQAISGAVTWKVAASLATAAGVAAVAGHYHVTGKIATQLSSSLATDVLTALHGHANTPASAAHPGGEIAALRGDVAALATPAVRAAIVQDAPVVAARLAGDL